MCLVKCNNLTKNYGANNAVDNVNIEIGKGKIIGLLGANGSGKTTLIIMINELLEPTSGEILINNEKPGIESKKIISYLPERTYLDMQMTPVQLVQYFKDFYADFDEAKAFELFNSLNLDVNAKMITMSKGTREKVQLSLVMARKAELYILDEPIGGVDPASRDFIIQTIMNNFNDGATLLISTHLITDIENILDEVIFINRGKIILHENADQLRESRDASIDAIFREEFKC
ncbi:MAG: ABC transporter ATP-binding protein [Erysipelotrichales bacterium]